VSYLRKIRRYVPSARPIEAGGKARSKQLWPLPERRQIGTRVQPPSAHVAAIRPVPGRRPLSFDVISTGLGCGSTTSWIRSRRRCPRRMLLSDVNNLLPSSTAAGAAAAAGKAGRKTVRERSAGVLTGRTEGGCGWAWRPPARALLGSCFRTSGRTCLCGRQGGRTKATRRMRRVCACFSVVCAPRAGAAVATAVNILCVVVLSGFKIPKIPKIRRRYQFC